MNGVGFRLYFGYGKWVRAGIYDNDFSFCLASLAKCVGRFSSVVNLNNFQSQLSFVHFDEMICRGLKSALRQ